MEKNIIIRAKYNETFLKIIIAEVNWLLAYWNISEEYNKRFTEQYGEKFFEETKLILKIKNLSNVTEEIIEVKEPTNNYYIKFNYSDSIYQVELIRIGKKSGKEYGYKLESNKIHSPNIKILIDNYDKSKIKFRNIKTGKEEKNTKCLSSEEFTKEDIKRLYEDIIKPTWNEYKKENGYKEK